MDATVPSNGDPNKLEPAPEAQLMKWIPFERYVRGANYGAASDMLHVQLLISKARCLRRP